MTIEQLRTLRDRLYLQDEIPDEALDDDEARPTTGRRKDSPEYEYLHGAPPRARRLAARRGAPRCTDRSTCPATSRSPSSPPGSGKQAVSTTMAFTRLLRNLARDRAHRRAHRADHPRRGPHVRHGLAVQRARDLRPARPALRAGRPRPAALATPRPRDGQILEEGITEAGVDGELHRRRHGLRHPRRADDPVLHLLLDVRVPAGRRPDLGGRRPAGPRLPARRHRRAHHAARRGPAARRTATASCWPRPSRPCQAYDPAFAYETADDRAPRHHRTCTAPDGRGRHVYYLTLYNENYAMPPHARQASRRGSSRACTGGPTAPDGPVDGGTSLFSGPANVAAREAQTSWPSTTASASSCGAPRPTSACATRRSPSTAWNRLHPDETPRVPRIAQLLTQADVEPSLDDAAPAGRPHPRSSR